MMERIKDLNVDIFKLFDEHWALVTAGTPEDYNTMTISWGSLGTIWAPRGNGKQIATIYVKPSRHTFGYLEQSDYYTVSFFPQGLGLPRQPLRPRRRQARCHRPHSGRKKPRHHRLC